MLRAAARHVRNVPRKLVSITRSHSSTDMSSTGQFGNMPAFATVIVTGPSALRGREEGLRRCLVPHVDDGAENPLASEPGCRALDGVVVQVAEGHAGAGSVECLRDAQADPGARPGHDSDGLAEVEGAHEGLLWCHRTNSSAVEPRPNESGLKPAAQREART